MTIAYWMLIAAVASTAVKTSVPLVTQLSALFALEGDGFELLVPRYASPGFPPHSG